MYAHHHQTHSQGSLSAAQIAQLSQYDRVGEYSSHHLRNTSALPSPSSFSDLRSLQQHAGAPPAQYARSHTPSLPGPQQSSSAGGYLRTRTQTPPTDGGNMPGAFGGSSVLSGGGVLRSYSASGGSSNVLSSSTGHGHLVSLKQPASPTLSSALVLAAQPSSPQQPPSQAHLMQLVPAAPQPSPPPQQHQQQPPPVIATAVPAPTTSSTTTTTTVTTAAPAMSVSPTINATPSPVPTSILLHIPLIPTPFRVALPPPNAPYVLTEKINALLSNPAIQDRISNALSVPKPNGWILVERVSAEYLQLRDLLGAIREGRLMTEGVVPWVCAGELVEGGVGYWCLGVCT
ncbi:hypothetical protein DFH27DRAFT_604967 [Peziza echinospora]|nr:hypothetical protein DFH27DRAFT_604967 [Peziza echinospora]